MTMFMVSKYRGMISLSKYSCPYYVLTTFSVRFFAMKIAYFDLFTIFFSGHSIWLVFIFLDSVKCLLSENVYLTQIVHVIRIPQLKIYTHVISLLSHFGLEKRKYIRFG